MFAFTKKHPFLITRIIMDISTIVLIGFGAVSIAKSGFFFQKDFKKRERKINPLTTNNKKGIVRAGKGNVEGGNNPKKVSFNRSEGS